MQNILEVRTLGEKSSNSAVSSIPEQCVWLSTIRLRFKKNSAQQAEQKGQASSI